MIKAPEYIVSAIKRVESIYFIFNAIIIAPTPNAAVNTLLINTAFSLFKFLINP